MKRRYAYCLLLALLAGCSTKTEVSSSSSNSPISSSESLVSNSGTSIPASSSSPLPSSSTPLPSSSSSSSFYFNDDFSAYYSGVSGTGRALFDSLHTRMNKGFKSLGYDGLLNVYPETDGNSDGTIHDYYSKVTHYHMSDANGGYKKEGDSFNREHSIPKSWWGGSKDNQGCDVYIVVPTDGYVNNRRSNFPFGLTSGGTYKSSGGYCKLGPSTLGGWTSTDVFEPGDDTKGDFARIYFYALTKWDNAWKWTQGNGGSTFSGSLDTNMGLTDYALNLFLEWHKQDPVDDYERHKNDVAVTHQGNRNPYVDHPEWVNAIWGGSYEQLAPTSISLYASKQSIYIGDTLSLSVNVSPLGASKAVTYKSLNPDIATIDENGLLTGLSVGKATIEATSKDDSSVKTTIEIEVKDHAHIDMEFITCKAITIGEGDKKTLEVETYPFNAYPRPTYEFSSLDESVATVSNDGTVTGIKAGSTTVVITARQGEIVCDKEVSVTVNAKTSGCYVKATSSISDGQYLLVAESSGKALNANEVSDKKNSGCQTSVNIVDGAIQGDYSSIAFTIKKVKQGYSIQTPNGDYVYAPSKSDFGLASLPVYNEITFSKGEAEIKCDNYVLRYNSSYFRYYSSKSTGYPVALYRQN